MSIQGVRGPAIRENRRRKAVPEFDLNISPPTESCDQEGTSSHGGLHDVQTGDQRQAPTPPMIDVEAIDDDIIESSPRAFAEAKNNSKRSRGRTIVAVDLDDQITVTNNCTKRRDSSNVQIINCDLYINLENSSNSKNVGMPSPPPPRKEPIFNCPICMGPLVEEMTTRCGHIFCKECIKTAMRAQGKCPTCRKKITVKELIRVFLPAAS